MPAPRRSRSAIRKPPKDATGHARYMDLLVTSLLNRALTPEEQSEYDAFEAAAHVHTCWNCIHGVN